MGHFVRGVADFVDVIEAILNVEVEKLLIGQKFIWLHFLPKRAADLFPMSLTQARIPQVSNHGDVRTKAVDPSFEITNGANGVTSRIFLIQPLFELVQC